MPTLWRSMRSCPRIRSSRHSSRARPGCGCPAPSIRSSSWCERSSGSRSRSRGPGPRWAGSPPDSARRSIPRAAASPTSSRAAEQVAEIRPDAFEMPRGRAKAIRRVAELVVAGRSISPATRRSSETLRHPRRRSRDWAVDPRLRGDACSPRSGRLPCRRPGSAQGLRGVGSARHTEETSSSRAERWRPWRAYAVMHLWHAHQGLVRRH